ncbi:2-oxo-4-hydroxy-4-carboxy-5-ureidoimidazoline decarboxylase [Aeromicrobium duanguangcaii]|uniref:2-oxo-4-hydroxy-4-carboxy-5-ureidoimidazoline decarboxylase n=1 Tax=Aeromicrobium duanguangcaii TaxID=2968086 RepID=A0ABY5KHX8_9ACTN|nr:2-oxo-4-hydroxy-4-carboxy-5-ureidoimidazoline decarboxylase [Aeromicrobium duanguangcaii]MCD9153513.1 2-oxo-4-hydroxy-4-carboxy-5-ureidoimidazoline decarboxylase [Aeromicrobium duanguangcaii]MCL3836502.1 2-oxo-4-hydroxy-4-carboxy-5-ureidoimidazoline decarboxylase [Aeromicrobium duanguangcaii]UUI69399.1 2-oxo-4-hydroxy-4-carboxy-5-ureidoimidazoline decarboxylase [Aeromicrobium duanguangcaii]
MDITTFDEADPATAAALVRACAAIESWVDDVVASRPYGSLDNLLDLAGALSARWGATEVEEALADHPRIGERHEGAGAGAGLSRQEQSGVDRSTDTVARLAEGNRRYEDRFGRIFLIRAAGRDAEEILEHLERRLDNDPDTELAVTAGQLREIAALRLKGSFS